MKKVFLSVMLLEAYHTEACEQLLRNVDSSFVQDNLEFVSIYEVPQVSPEVRNVDDVRSVDESDIRNFNRASHRGRLLCSLVDGGLLSIASCGMFGLFSLCKDYFYNENNDIATRGIALSLGLFSCIGGGISIAFALKAYRNAYNYFN